MPVRWIIIVALLASGPLSAQHATPFSALEAMSPTDKTMWLVTDEPKVGSILYTNPSGWSEKYGVSFSRQPEFLELNNRVPTELGSGATDENLQISKRIDLGALLPILGGIGGAFKHTRTVSITAKGETITQQKPGAIKQALLDYDRNVDTPDNKVRSNLFASINHSLDQTGNATDKVHYWIVTKVWRAASSTWTAGRAHSASVGLGCGSVPDAADPATLTPAPAPSPSPSPSPSPADTPKFAEEGKAKPSGEANFNLDQKGNLKTSASAKIGGTGASGKDGTKVTASLGDGTSCRLGKFAIGSGRLASRASTNAIIFVEIRPIVRDKNGRLTIPEPDAQDQVLAPKTVSRST